MKSLNFNSKPAKPKKMHKKLLKQALSLLLVLLTLISAFPLSINNVYAKGGKIAGFQGKNIGSSSSGGNGPINGSDQWLSHLQTDAVQAYAYDTKNGQFIQGTYGDTTFKVIQFLGIDNIYNNVSSYENQGALYKTNDTSFGTVNASDVYRANEYPFRTSDDGDITAFYNSGWGEFTANTSKIDSWLTAEVDGKESARLGDIINKYWGEAAYNKMVRNPNVVIIIEPMMLVEVQVSTDNDGDGLRKLHDNVSKEAVDEIIRYDYDAYEIFDHTYSGDVCDCGKWGALSNSSDYYYFDDIEAELEEQRPRSEDPAFWETIDNAIYDPGFDHIEISKTPVINHIEGYNIDYYYNMLLATSRWVKENNEKGNKMQVYEHHNVPTWGLYSMYSDGLGKKNEDGSYDTSKWDSIFVFPYDYEVINSDGAKNIEAPIYNADNHRALTYGDKRSTLGMVMYSPSGLFGGDYIHHTNNYSQSEPSAADSCANEKNDEPNASYSYGSNIVVKTYETRNKNTGKLVDSLSFMQWGIPDTISIEDEYSDEWVTSTFTDEYGNEKSRPYVDWMLSRPNTYTCDGDSVLAKGCGYHVSDWKTSQITEAQAKDLSNNIGWSNSFQPTSTRMSYQYLTKNYPAIASGKGAKFTVTLGSNGDNYSAAGDENILFVRLIKLVDDDGGDGGEETTFSGANGALTESKIATIVSASSILSNDQSPQSYTWGSLWLAPLGELDSEGNKIKADNNNYWGDNHFRLGYGVNVDKINYADKTIGYFLSWQDSYRSLADFAITLCQQSTNFTVRRESDWTGSQINNIVTNVDTLNISKTGAYDGFNNITNGAHSALLSKYNASANTPSNPSDVPENTVDTNISTSNDNRTMKYSVDTEDGSTDTDSWTNATAYAQANEYPDHESAWISSKSNTDNEVYTLAIETLNSDSNSNISTIKKNNSGVEGSVSSYVAKSVTPLVEMHYTMDDVDTGRIDEHNVLTSRNATRTFACNSYAAISYIQPCNLIISSNMFAIDNILTCGDKQWNTVNNTLKGGSIYSVGTGSDSQKVNITTVQMVQSGSYDNSAYVNYSEDCSEATVKNNHAELVNEVTDNLKNSYLKQWLSDNTDNISSRANEDSGAIAVSGSTDELYDESHGFSKTNKFNNNIELQNDSKYWFSTDESNRNTAVSAFFDITNSKDTVDYYKIVFNTDGTVWILTSKDSSFPANKTSVLEKLSPEQGLSDIKNQDVIMLDKETNVLSNMFNVMVRGAGNDVTATWTKTGKWHNEYVEVTLMKQNTQLEMKLAYPSQRTTVVDPSLQAPSESKLDTFTKALKFNYTTNMSNLETLGYFKSLPVKLKNADILFLSENKYITNGSIQDNN